MDSKRQKNQLELAFREESGSEAPKPTQTGIEKSAAKLVHERLALPEQLMEEICEPGNLKKALWKVRSNKGSPGIDCMPVAKLGDYLMEHWPSLREQLLNGTYVPQPVKRVEIPKPGGGVRKLGVPTALDRWIQQAVLQVLQRYWDPTFSKHSYGFRPARSAHQAVAQAQAYVREGYDIVVDLDLENFFDRIQHDRLMGQLAKRVKDKRVLKLVRSYLTAGVMEDGLVRPTTEGSPQGGPLSPILSNIVLDELDQELEQRGHRFCRFADDFQVYVKTERAGQRVKESLTRFIMRTLKLRINEEKSAVAPIWERQFLGFRIAKGEHRKRCISQRSITRFKARIRELTARNQGRSLEVVIRHVSQYLRSWLTYYGFCEARYVLRDLDSWIRRRLRSFIWKQWKTFRRRRSGLMNRGIGEAMASQTAARSSGPWTVSKVKPLRIAFSTAYFSKLGLYCLFA